MSSMFHKVREFHRDFGHPTPDKPGWLDPARLATRRKWQYEERVEFDEAVAEGNLVAAADALADELYFLLGTCVEMGLPMDEIFDAVHFANMSKAQHLGPHAAGCEGGKRCTCGKILYDHTGKTKKPAGWTGPEREIENIIKLAEIV
jgi:predicted HAD superfamily Cof-like phosphohydrolase